MLVHEVVGAGAAAAWLIRQVGQHDHGADDRDQRNRQQPRAKMPQFLEFQPHGRVPGDVFAKIERVRVQRRIVSVMIEKGDWRWAGLCGIAVGNWQAEGRLSRNAASFDRAQRNPGFVAE